VLRHGAARNVSFPLQSLGSIDVRHDRREESQRNLARTHPIYTWLIGCVSVKKIFNNLEREAVV
jgi:hypothetical protein